MNDELEFKKLINWKIDFDSPLHWCLFPFILIACLFICVVVSIASILYWAFYPFIVFTEAFFTKYISPKRSKE